MGNLILALLLVIKDKGKLIRKTCTMETNGLLRGDVIPTFTSSLSPYMLLATFIPTSWLNKILEHEESLLNSTPTCKNKLILVTLVEIDL